MARNTGTVAHKRRKKKIMKKAKGMVAVGGRYRLAKERVMRADAFAYIGRKQRKRNFRQLWITRLSAAAQAHDLRYSQFIDGLRLAGIELNRKMLSEVAIHDPEAFAKIADEVKAALANKPAA